jgi:16S rRNA G966 N2-methylase RsmD
VRTSAGHKLIARQILHFIILRLEVYRMRKVFWDNPYQQSLITQVVSVEVNKILLAETIAFSFAGGQESDKGMIKNYPIINSEIVGNLIYYT